MLFWRLEGMSFQGYQTNKGVFFYVCKHQKADGPGYAHRPVRRPHHSGHFPLFPAAAFLQYDPADVAILIGAFAFGPLAGLAVTVIASAIQAFLLGGDGVYGFLMHVIASGTLALVAGSIYRLRHTRMGGLTALIAGTVAMGLVDDGGQPLHHPLL